MNTDKNLIELTASATSKTHLVIAPETTLEQWLEIGTKFNRADNMLKWMLGDWMAFGMSRVTKWGHSIYDRAVEVTGFTIETLQNVSYVCTNVNVSLRSETLYFAHHACVAALDENQQSRWIAAAIKHSLSKRELAASIKANKVIRLAQLVTAGRQRAIPFEPESIRLVFERTFNHIAREHPDIGTWPALDRAKWKSELKPIADLYAKL